MGKHGEAWRSDWRARIVAELERRGALDLNTFAVANGCVTYPQVAAALGSDLAPIQMMMAFRTEYLGRGDYPGFVADTLYRYLLEYVIAPPADRMTRELQATAAIAAAGAATGAQDHAAIIAVWTSLRERILDGWLPSSSTDFPLLTAVRAQCWRSAASE